MLSIKAIRWVLVLMSICFSNVVDSRKENQCPYETIREPMLIESPLFEKNIFPNFFRCWYNITAPENKVVSIKFTTFSFPPIRTSEMMNYGPVERECISDYLQATINVASSNENSQKFCGYELQNRRLVSTDNRMQLLFQSMNINGFDPKSFKGFQAEITFVDKVDVNYCEDVVVMGEDRVPIAMDSNSKCSLAVKAPKDKIPEVVLTENPNAYIKNCNVKFTMGPEAALPHGVHEWQYGCKDHVTTINRNSNFVPFTLFNQGNEKAQFDLVFDYRKADKVQVCGNEIALNSASTTFDITISKPGRYSCMWTYTTKGTPYENIEGTKTPTITVNEIEMEEPNSNGICFTNRMAVILEYDGNSYASDYSRPLLCGKRKENITVSNPGRYKDMAAAILFLGRVPENGRAIIRGNINL